MADEIRLVGFRELVRACDAMGGELKSLLRDELRKAGEIVRDDARRRFSAIDVGSAFGFGVSVRRAGIVSVEQRRRRVTGKRGDYGALQMRRALMPAVEAKRGEVEKEVEELLDYLGRRHGF